MKSRIGIFVVFLAVSTLALGMLGMISTVASAQEIMVNAIPERSEKPLPLYGINTMNTKGPPWSDKSFRDMAASLHFKIARYPGGNIAELWDWRKGWFVDTDAQGQIGGFTMPDNFRTMKYSPSGFPEFKMLVDETHCDAVFVLNMVTRNLDDQIEMLKYAQSIGIPIKWVELGNEYNNTGSAGRKKYVLPQDYGTTSRNWITAIKEHFPNAKIAVIGGNRQSPSLKDWNSIVLTEAPNADAIVAHLYPFPSKVLDSNGINYEKLFSAFKEDYDRQGFNAVNKNIWITEYNIHWAYVPNVEPTQRKIIQQYAFTWGQALAIILMTSEATTITGAVPPQMIVEHGISNWENFAAIQTYSGPLRILPAGMGYKAWADASNNKTSLRQIHFQISANGYANDFDLLGWQFNSPQSGNTSLLVNFTSNPISVDVSALGETAKTYYDVKHADKNKLINSDADVISERIAVTNHKIQLPPYSIATL